MWTIRTHPQFKTAMSPMSLKAYTQLADPDGQTALINYVNDYHKAHPLADSQEGYNMARNYVQHRDGSQKCSKRK
jgi:hypothetical protein